MSLPADHAAREEARITFDVPVVVEAGAGTGKTAVLVKRIVTWLIGPGWARHEHASEAATPEDTATVVLQRVLALTFTEKAAGEMSERVADTLDLLARGKDYLGLDASAFPDIEAQTVAERASACLIHLDRLLITTIHAWCRRVLVSYPIEAALHPAFEVDADGMRRRAVLDEVITEWVTQDFGDATDPDSMALAAAGHGPDAIWRTLRTLAVEGIDPQDVDTDPFSAERLVATRARLMPVLETIAEAISPLIGVKRATVGDRVASWVLEFRDALQAASDFRDVTSVFACDDLKKIKDKLAAWRKGEFTKSEEAHVEPSLRPELAAALDTLTTETSIWAAVDPDLMPRAARLVKRLLQEAQSRMHRLGIISFGDLLARADVLLQDEAVCRRVRNGYDQLLVDEFQDTDRRQYDVVGRIALEGQPAERPALFLVGDPKQSIYGWRQADLAAYERFLDRLKASHGTSPRKLTVNFRSVPAILDEVERIMAHSMEESPGLQPPFEPLRPSPALCDAQGFIAEDRRPVESWVSWNRDGSDGAKTGMATSSDVARDIEAAAIASDIRTIHDAVGTPWGSFGLLFRSRSSVEKYLRALREAGIPYVVEGDRNFYKRREVIDVVSFVRVILDPNDHIALVGFIRSPMVGVPDAALIPLWAHSFPQLMSELREGKRDVFAKLRDAIESAAASVPTDIPADASVSGWQDGLSEAVLAVARLRRSFTEDAADTFVERLRAALLSEPMEGARYLGKHRAANLEQIFRKIFEALTTGDSGPDAVLRLLRERVDDAAAERDGTIPEDDVDAVRVMTVHMAKGLAFDHVYLPDLHRRGSNRESTEARVTQTPDGMTEARLLGMPTPGFGLVQRHENAVRMAELVRLLYVATTRARQRLVLVGRWGDPDAMKLDSMLGLVATRHGSWRGMIQGWAGSPDDAAPWTDDEFGVRWRLLGSDTDRPAHTDDHQPRLPDLQSVRARSLRWRAEAESARDRAATPRTKAASADSHEAMIETLRDRHDETAQDHESGGVDPASISTIPNPDARSPIDGPPGSAFAREVGTAIHRVLERLDLSGEQEASCDEALQRLEAEIADLVAPDQLSEALAAARPIAESLGRSRLVARLFALGDDLIGREVPILSASAATGSASANPGPTVVGAIDLIYRDPTTGEVVVADYKTDHVRTDESLEDHARRYAAQGAAYTRAVQEAFRLDQEPRFELWFLRHDAVL